MSPALRRIRGLYAITPDDADTARLTAQVRHALDGGVRILQYRNKIADDALRQAQAAALCTLCREYGALFIVNDDVDVALAVDADGVHLGGSDGSLAATRAKIGAQKLLGASCYNRIENAAAALRAGADHVAFGSFFASSVKPGAVHAPLALLTEAKRTLRVPVVAIGGITLDNAAQLIDAGADSLAVISALFGAGNVTMTAQKFNALFDDRP